MTKKIRSGLLSVLDIGTTKIVCFIARVNANGELNIIGIGHQVSQGMNAGIITDVKKVEGCVLAAVNAAEHMAGETIDRVIVNVTGGKLASHLLQLDMPINGHEITSRDISRIMNMGLDKVQMEGCSVIYYAPVAYTIDGADGIKDPLAMYGNQLGVKLHAITASATALMNITHCLARCHLNVADFVASPYAAATACLTRDEMELGVTLLDIGGGNTSFSVFKDGKMVFAGSIPLGGGHITRDIAHGLAVDVANAERVKTLYGNTICTEADEEEMIDIPQFGDAANHEMGTVSRATLVSIIRPRVEEILEMVKARVQSSGVEEISGSRVVLTGGGSQLLGMKELTGFVLGKQVRIASPLHIEGLAESTKGAAFSAAIGMLKSASAHASKTPLMQVGNQTGGVKDYCGRMMGWLRENF